MTAEGEIGTLLAGQGFVIAYSPLRTEVDWHTLPPFSTIILAHLIPPRAGLDPSGEAKKVVAAVGTADAVILMPGRRFDSSGTRHGQGGGWYDRFLAEVPRDWLRIGFCYDDQFSKEPLRRERWDQAMDYVVVVDRETGRIALYLSEGGIP